MKQLLCLNTWIRMQLGVQCPCFNTALTEISNAALAVPLHQDVSALQVSVGDSWLFLGADDLRVEVHQATGHRQAHPQAALWLQAAVLQEVVEWTQLMEVSDEPQLGAGIFGCHVRGYETYKAEEEMSISISAFWLELFQMTSQHREGVTTICCRTQDVVVSQLHGVVNLCLSEPGLLVSGGEDLHSHTLPHPGSPPHLPIPAFTWRQRDTITQLQSHTNRPKQGWEKKHWPTHSASEICLAMVLWTRYGSPVPLPDVQNSSNMSWRKRDRDDLRVKTPKSFNSILFNILTSNISYAVCGVVSIRDLEHGDVLIFSISRSAASMLEAQEQHQATHAGNHDEQQHGHSDPQLWASYFRWRGCWFSIWTHTTRSRN